MCLFVVNTDYLFNEMIYLMEFDSDDNNFLDAFDFVILLQKYINGAPHGVSKRNKMASVSEQY